VKVWQAREYFVPRKPNIKNILFMNPEKVFLPRIHIRLGLMRNFVETLDKIVEGFIYLRSKFPNLSDDKVKEGIFVGPQIGRVMFNENFERKFNST
jgi:hypothetical protein